MSSSSSSSSSPAWRLRYREEGVSSSRGGYRPARARAQGPGSNAPGEGHPAVRKELCLTAGAPPILQSALRQPSTSVPAPDGGCLANLRLHMRFGRGLQPASGITVQLYLDTVRRMPHNYQVSRVDIGTGLSSPRLAARQPLPVSLRPAACAAPGSLLSTMDALIGHSTQSPRSRRSSIEPVEGLHGRACSRDDPARREGSQCRENLGTIRLPQYSPLLSLAEPRHMHDSMHLNARASQADVFPRTGLLLILAHMHTCTHAHMRTRTWIHSDRWPGHDLDSHSVTVRLGLRLRPV